jgi:hypothetical protein
MNSAAASTIDTTANPVAGYRSDVKLTFFGKLAIWTSIVSVLFLSQIAYNIGEFPVSVDLISYVLSTLYLLVSGYVAFDLISLALFVSLAALAALRMPFSDAATSWTSLLLLLALYAPFSLRLNDRYDLEPVQRYIQYSFVSAAAVIGVIAIVQIVLVNALNLTILTNIHFVLPAEIRSAGTYAYTREGTGFLKANGFFLRESSWLSLVMALAFIIEYYTRARWKVLSILAAGLIVSFSGSGIFAIIAGFLLPRSIGRVPVFIVAFGGVVLILLVIDSMDIPFLNVWFGRLDEFTTPNTSGYARFVAPIEMVSRAFDDGILSNWLGRGAGSYLRETSLLRVKYEISDPTWAKLVYEYGLVGLGLVSSIVISRLYSSNARVEVCNYFTFIWLTVGLLLKPDVALVMWLLTLAPKRRSDRFVIMTGSSHSESRRDVHRMLQR